MPRKLKVYGWTGFRHESRQPGNPHAQTREILAAPSVAEVLRVTGMTRHQWTVGGSETGNEEELEVALAKPGVVFWKPLNKRSGKWHEAQAEQ